ncbi:hypothetical protein J6T21_01030 [Candidatus Saccharibacteria bacterium]|nr:hypothetical protein [Candidatus Saccharibacteria bacterium]
MASTNIDYTEKAIVFVSDDAEYKDYSAAKLVKQFFKNFYFRNKKLNIRIQKTIYKNEGVDYRAYVIDSFHRKFDDSIFDWHAKFSDFVKFFENEVGIGHIFMTKLVNFDKTTESRISRI